MVLDVERKVLSDRVKSTDLHSTKPWILVSLNSGNVHIWNYESELFIKSFKVCGLPVRSAKFIVRKSWIITGSDDMQVRIFNYNTLERVHQFKAHSNYIRSIAVHPTQPFILTSSDDMMIKSWNWDNKWEMKQIFEGHKHYVMQLVINPKDNKTFASASLDKTVKVWQFGLMSPKFTLEGHDKGVNCIDYYHGEDKPYLISGADDKMVKIWDYQNKICVATLSNYSHNISAVCFHPELPIFIIGSEDSIVRIYHSNSNKLQNSLNYGLSHVWCISYQPGLNNIAIGYDNGVVVVKFSRDVGQSPEESTRFLTKMKLFLSNPSDSKMHEYHTFLKCAIDEGNLESLFEFIKKCYKENIESVLKEINNGHDILETFTEEWIKFYCATNLVNSWTYEFFDDSTYRHTIREIAIESWNNYLFSVIADQLTAAILKFIENQRNDHLNNKPSKTSIIPWISFTPEYQKNFELKLIVETKDYYEKLMDKLFYEFHLVEYWKKVVDLLKEERHRAEQCFDPSTTELLMKACDQVLILNHLNELRAEFDKLLKNNEVEELAEFFSLCKRVELLDVLKAVMKCHVEGKGRNAMKSVLDAANDPKFYINMILDMHKQFATLVTVAFKNDPGFVQAMNKGFSSFINRNSVTEGNKGAHKTPELVARYCDMLLRKSTKNSSEDEVEEALSQVLIIFKYIEDEDVFEKFYSKMLAKRLVYELSTSEYAEKFMFEKFKQIYGFEYTRKWRRMLRDTTMSKKVSLKFKEYAQDQNIDLQKIDLSVQILSQGTWPFEIAETCSVPPIIADVLGKFRTYYMNQHSGRKLTYLNQMSRGEVVCNHIPGKCYTVVASMGQMAVLLLFNDDVKFTFKELVDSLNFKPDQLIETLEPLIKLEMLKTNGVKIEKDMAVDTVIELNSKFISKKIRIDLSKVLIHPEAPKKQSNIQLDLEENKKMMLIQGAIVRFMKTYKKKYHHQALIVEVMKQLTNRFTPNVKLIKKCIDSLIEREYLARVEGERDCYHYLP